MDHAELEGKLILITVDASTKWIDATVVSSTSSAATIDRLRELFATFGLPSTVVSDNATGFTSNEFQQFMKRNGIIHITASPYHPASNGLAEQSVRAVKEALRKMLPSDGLKLRLVRLLFRYRNTPQSSTGRTPAELMFGRPLKGHLQQLQNSILRERVEKLQEQQKESRGGTLRVFNPGDNVMAWSGQGRPLWLPGVVVSKVGPVMYTIEMENGRLWTRHIDHIIRRTAYVTPPPMPEVVNQPVVPALQPAVPVLPPSQAESSQVESSVVSPPVSPPPAVVSSEMCPSSGVEATAPPVVLRRSSRVSKPVVKYQAGGK